MLRLTLIRDTETNKAVSLDIDGGGNAVEANFCDFSKRDLIRSAFCEMPLFSVETLRIGQDVDIEELLRMVDLTSLSKIKSLVLAFPTSHSDLKIFAKLWTHLTRLEIVVDCPERSKEQIEAFIGDLGHSCFQLTHLHIKGYPGRKWQMPFRRTIEILTITCPRLEELSFPVDLADAVPDRGMIEAVFLNPLARPYPNIRVLELHLTNCSNTPVTALHCVGRLLQLISPDCVLRTVYKGEPIDQADATFGKELVQSRAAIIEHWRNVAARDDLSRSGLSNGR